MSVTYECSEHDDEFSKESHLLFALVYVSVVFSLYLFICTIDKQWGKKEFLLLISSRSRSLSRIKTKKKTSQDNKIKKRENDFFHLPLSALSAYSSCFFVSSPPSLSTLPMQLQLLCSERLFFILLVLYLYLSLCLFLSLSLSLCLVVCTALHCTALHC